MFSFSPTATAIITKASDDWDKINFKGEVEIVDFVQRIVAATDDKGKLTFKTRDAEARSVALPVTLGVIPDYGYSGTGMRIDGVSKGKTAEKAGLQAGDILLQLGEYKFQMLCLTCRLCSIFLRKAMPQC